MKDLDFQIARQDLEDSIGLARESAKRFAFNLPPDHRAIQGLIVLLDVASHVLGTIEIPF